MTERARYTFQLTLRDNHSFDEPLSMAIDLSPEILRAVGEMKMGLLAGPEPLRDVVEMMKRREFRKDLFIKAAEQLARQMAERMEDAEGWHDVSRIGPARKSLGGRWE